MKWIVCQPSSNFKLIHSEEHCGLDERLLAPNYQITCVNINTVHWNYKMKYDGPFLYQIGRRNFSPHNISFVSVICKFGRSALGCIWSKFEVLL